jgi:hypothetical protein
MRLGPTTQSGLDLPVLHDIHVTAPSGSTVAQRTKARKRQRAIRASSSARASETSGEPEFVMKRTVPG